MQFVKLGMIPVINAINHDGNGQLLNTNADTVACAVAAALKGDLICCFEFNGVLKHRNDPTSVIPEISEKDFNDLVKNGTIAEGMIPKIENCLSALRTGAVSAVIKNAVHINDDIGTRVKL